MTTHIYFFSHDGRIKIGVARDVQRRLAAVGLHLAAQPTLIGSVPGTYQFERAIHKRLAMFRLKGEWFEDEPEVRALIAHILVNGRDAIGFVQPPPPPAYMAVKKTKEEWRETDIRLLQIMWPLDGIQQFAAFVERPQAEVHSWFDGTVAWPRLMRFVFASLITHLLASEKPLPNFLAGEWFVSRGAA